nr:hypothetical protein [Tanacetum cinerariifolium]
MGIRRVVPRNYNPKGERSSSKLARDQTSNPTCSANPTPKCRIRRSSKQKVENSHFEENLTHLATMTDNHTMVEMLRAPTEGCAEAIVVPLILAELFELKHSLINMITSEQFFGLEKDNPHDHLDTFYNALNPANQDSLNAAAGGNLLEKSPQDALMIIENKSKVRNSQSKPIASPVNAYDNHSSSELAKLTHAVDQQTSVVTTAMTAMLKQFQSNAPPAQVKVAEEICVTCGGAHPYYQCLAAGGNTFPEHRDNIQGYVSAATGNFNQGNPGYRPQGVANQMRPLGSGTLPGNTIANPKGELKAITTRSRLVTEGPTVPNAPKPINPEEDECVEETYTDPDHAEYNIKVPPPPPVQKPKPPIQRNFVLHTRDSLPPRIPYPSRMLKQKQQEKDDIQIQKFWNMFKQLHLNITLVEALVLMPKYQKMLKALLSNKEKL